MTCEALDGRRRPPGGLSAALRAPDRGRAGRASSSPPGRPQDHRGHQRGRDLHHDSRHPLRGGHRPGPDLALLPAHADHRAAGRAHLAQQRRPAQGPLRPRGARGSASGCTRRRTTGPAAVHRPRDPARQSGRGHPAHDRARPRRRRRSSPSSTGPSAESIADGFRLLIELGADRGRRKREGGRREGARGRGGGGEGVRLTETGRMMARMPLDPRLSRMLIEAREEGCVRGDRRDRRRPEHPGPARAAGREARPRPTGSTPPSATGLGLSDPAGHLEALPGRPAAASRAPAPRGASAADTSSPFGACASGRTFTARSPRSWPSSAWRRRGRSPGRGPDFGRIHRSILSGLSLQHRRQEGEEHLPRGRRTARS